LVQPRQALTAGAVALALGGLVVALSSSWDGARAFDRGGAAHVLVGAVVLFALPPLLQATSFVLALRGLGARAPWLPTLAVWTRSFLLRYAPTGALGYVYRLRRKDRIGAETDVLVKATGLEHLAVVAAAAIVGMAAFAWSGLAGALLAGGRVPARLLAVSLAGWLPTALGAWLIVSNIAPGAQLSPVRLVGVYAVAWLAGLLVPFAPGGLGVREAVLAALLVDPLGGSAAVACALALRLAAIVGEILAFAVVEAAYRAADAR
jgi:glycosyltransferase 2 family protein